MEGAASIVLWMDDTKELNKGELLGCVVWRDEEILCEAKERDKFENTSNRAGAGRVELGDKDVGNL